MIRRTVGAETPGIGKLYWSHQKTSNYSKSFRSFNSLRT
jgi:hypothetical protein